MTHDYAARGEPQPMDTLAGLTVVELGGSVAGAYCGKTFADQGATVLLVGQSFITSHQAAYLDRHKSSTDLSAIDWSTVDVIIESSAPDPLTPTAIDAPQAVRVQISPFGNTGPYATWRGTDLVDYAISGHSYLYGDPDRAPLKGPPDQPAIAAGLYGFIGAMAALFARADLGHGQTVEVSHFEVMTALHQVTLLRWIMTNNIFCRMGNRYTGQGQPNGPYPCKDGWISIVGVTEPQVEGLLAVTGLMHLMEHPDISVPGDFQLHPHLLDEPLIEWLSDQTVDDVVDLFQAMRIPACPLRTPLELLDDPQLIDREFFQPLPGTELMVPRAPFTLSHQQDPAGSAWKPGATDAGPLAGLKVLDLARVWAGPLCARTLSDLGADVVWVEAPWGRGPQQIPQSMLDSTRFFPNDEAGERPWNRNTHFLKYSVGKKSLAVDLQTEAGRAVFERLAPNHHVILENFSTRVMPQFGLDEERLHELNPDAIYLTMPGYGRSGPAENWLAYGSSVDSHAGLSALIGYEDETPWKGGIAWPDPIAGLHACSAVLGSLWASAFNGAGGVTIEAAQFESTLAAVGDRILEAQVDGPFVPLGNGDKNFVAQGVYRSLGHDAWVAISIPDQATADMFAEVLANHSESSSSAASTSIEQQLEELAARCDAAELASELQDAGVPAAPVTTSQMVMADPHLQARGAWVTVDQPDVGPFTVPPTPLRLSATPVSIDAPAPTLGQHNEVVLGANGFTAAEIGALAEQETIATRPPR